MGTGGGGGKRGWNRRSGGDNDNDEEDFRGPLDDWLNTSGKKATTSMRMTYSGEGHPLQLILYVSSFKHPLRMRFYHSWKGGKSGWTHNYVLPQDNGI